MKTIIALILSLFLASPVYASGWSFGLDGGLAVPTQNYFPTNTGDGGNDSLPYFGALESSEGPIVSAYATHTIGKDWISLGILGSWDNTGAFAISPVTPGVYNGTIQKRGYQYEGSGVKTNLGTIESWQIMPYLRFSPWTFGSITPFLGIGFGLSWNQWNNQWNKGIGSYSASISNGLATRAELGLDFHYSALLSVESMIGIDQNDPLGSVNLPFGNGGMDQEFNMTFFFCEIGIHFSL